MNKGSWLQEADDHCLVFRSPSWFSVIAYAIVLLFATVPQILTLAEFRSAAVNPSKAGFDYVMLGLWILMDGTVILSLLWLGGGTCLNINLKSRSYVHTRRWLFGTQIRRGTLEEMDGICLAGEDLSQLLLLFKKAPFLSKGYRLGMYSSQKHAKAEAQEFSYLLGVPIVKGLWS